MKHLICIALLFISTIVYGAEQKFFFTEKIYYTGVARQTNNHGYGFMECYAGLGFKFLDDSFKMSLNTTIGFSSKAGKKNYSIGRKGTLDAEFEYIQHTFPSPVTWGPALFTWNRFDSLSLEDWSGYTGSGVNVIGYSNKFVTIMFGVGGAFQYANYLKDTKYNTDRRNEFSLVYVLHGQIIYSPVERVKLKYHWKFLPVYDFSKAHIISEISIGVYVIKETYVPKLYTPRETSVFFELKVGVDHFTKQPTSTKKTDYTYGSAMTFSM